MAKLSIVVPCYNEEECLPLYYERTCSVIEKIPAETEFIFVDDGSSDRTLAILKQLALKDSRVRFVALSRNFGKEAAMYAGFKAAEGDFVGIMDVDLQDPPEMLTDMYKGVTEEGYDCVACRRTTRKNEPPVRSWFARLFYKIINHFTQTEIVDGARDFRIMSRKMTNAILSLTERDRFSKELFSWVGFKTKWLDYENIQRAKGKTKWSFKKLSSYAVGGIEGATTVILRVNLLMCIIFAIAAAGFVAADIILACVSSVSPLFILLPVLFFTASCLFLGMFLLGEYIKRIFRQVQNRPVYIVSETEKDFMQNDYNSWGG